MNIPAIGKAYFWEGSFETTSQDPGLSSFASTFSMKNYQIGLFLKFFKMFKRRNFYASLNAQFLLGYSVNGAVKSVNLHKKQFMYRKRRLVVAESSYSGGHNSSISEN